MTHVQKCALFKMLSIQLTKHSFVTQHSKDFLC